MNHFESHFEGYKGLSLYLQGWQAEQPKAVLAIVHGFGEHSGRYLNIINKLVPEGFTVVSFDHRGHGKSPGKRGHVMNWNEYTEDVELFLKHVLGKQKDLPVFLMGHSMGGLIVLTYAISNQDGLKGLIASAPLLAQPAISAVLVFISRILSKIWPGFSIDTKLDVNSISRDPEAIEAYKQDPLVHSMASARFGTELTSAMEWTQAHADELKMPLLVLHGAADPLVPEQGSEIFFKNASSQDKTRNLYPDGLHEPHNDLDREKVTDDLLNWLNAHL